LVDVLCLLKKGFENDKNQLIVIGLRIRLLKHTCLSMKKKIAFISMTLTVSGLLYFTGIHNSTAHDTGAPAGVTNSPHDAKSCDQNMCHNTNPLQSAKPWITSNIPVAGYTHDSVYTITAKAITVGDTSFGFEISPQTTAGAPLGTLIVTNSTTTKIVTSGTLQYMTHTINSYRGTDSATWTFQWKAPALGTGSVTFYGCFNCGNGNVHPTESFVYPATLTVAETPTDGIATIMSDDNSFSVFPNPVSRQINITYNVKEAANLEINIYGMDGKKIANLFNCMVSGETHPQGIALPSSISPGIYLMQFITNGQSAVQRIIVE
jgi:hypothetical protein